MFDITLNCSVSTDLCSKVQKAFETAGNIISSYLSLNTRIVLSASFESFCISYPSLCEDRILGFAAPARWILMEDDDSIQRLYPQSLVKQFGLSTHLEYSQNDIIASFNSDASYWFEEDSTPINETQYDFLYVMFHELHHGLGFSSAWDEFFTGYVTPIFANDSIKEVDVDDDLVYKDNNKYKFYECAFDKYLILMENSQRTSEITKKLNTFFTENKDFTTEFPGSTQAEYARQMYEIAQTPNSLGFLPRNSTNNKDAVILETSIVPYLSGSSISHVDNKTYTNTPDFLMRASVNNGINLDKEIISGGNYTLGPIGPKLKQVLETMGYQTADNPNPYKPKSIDGMLSEG
ncbi:621_t:CDS:2 [Diversispora eburnea]|uniref:621_t:CDS:1 n=1 Tax=Diversispora eburnea TaxID=1213867 RepID=A0A9N8ZAD5_9GLOM|nr:621_t:CDS:2 [Diversispora eburnea]